MTKKYGQILLCMIAGAVLSFMALPPVRPAVAQDYPETTPTGTPAIPPQFYLTPWEGNRGSWISIKGSTFTNSSNMMLLRQLFDASEPNHTGPTSHRESQKSTRPGG